LWYFLTIHDSILHPLVGFLKWKAQREDRLEAEAIARAAAIASEEGKTSGAGAADNTLDSKKRPLSVEGEAQALKRSKLIEQS
jgi:hypothetical protein